jgi:hypothetical protein
MKSAHLRLGLGSLFSLIVVASCGGDDGDDNGPSGGTTSAGTSSGGASSGGSSSAGSGNRAGSSSGGTSNTSGGTSNSNGGTSSNGGSGPVAGCPAARPDDGDDCDVASGQTCEYGDESCLCAANNWLCYEPPGGFGGGPGGFGGFPGFGECPGSAPMSGQDCEEFAVCQYGNTYCGCDGQQWTCGMAP